MRHAFSLVKISRENINLPYWPSQSAKTYRLHCNSRRWDRMTDEGRARCVRRRHPGQWERPDIIWCNIIQSGRTINGGPETGDSSSWFSEIRLWAMGGVDVFVGWAGVWVCLIEGPPLRLVQRGAAMVVALFSTENYGKDLNEASYYFFKWMTNGQTRLELSSEWYIIPLVI